MLKFFIYTVVIIRPAILSKQDAILSRVLNLAAAPDNFRKNRTCVATVLCRTISTSSQNWKKMVDPKRVVSYEDMLKVINQPEKVIIDVRNPDEVHTTGKIPSSINIPLSTVQDVLKSMSNEEFKNHYQRNKPTSSDELIFYCQSGRRSTEALDKALKLGYANSKTYLGSWNDWSSRQK